MNILLGVTGSVAAIKLPELHGQLSKLGTVRTVVTDSAMRIIKKIKQHGIGHGRWDEHKAAVFLEGYAEHKDDPNIPLWTEEDEWKWAEIGDPVLHIDLKDWADVLVIAPLTANTLAKMANGLSDNLLTCIARAWPDTKPMVLAPAMNTDMWNHRITRQHLRTLRELYRNPHLATPDYDPQQVFVVNPIDKKLACGTTGMGAMANVETIVGEVVGTIERFKKDAEKR